MLYVGVSGVKCIPRFCVICGSTGFRSPAPGTQPPKQIPHPPTRRSPSVAPPWHSSSITASPRIPYSPPIYKNVYSPPSQSLTSRESPKLRRRGPGAVPESQSSPEYRIVPQHVIRRAGRGAHPRNSQLHTDSFGTCRLSFSICENLRNLWTTKGPQRGHKGDGALFPEPFFPGSPAKRPASSCYARAYECRVHQVRERVPSSRNRRLPVRSGLGMGESRLERQTERRVGPRNPRQRADADSGGGTTTETLGGRLGSTGGHHGRCGSSPRRLSRVMAPPNRGKADGVLPAPPTESQAAQDFAPGLPRDAKICLYDKGWPGPG